MVYLSDVFEQGTRPSDIAAHISNGLVTERVHPEFPELRILNYTPKAAYEREWNTITLNSRGLIYNANTHEVLARPFQKFFNYGQPEAPAVPMQTDLYHVSNKWDGSLGIGYIRPDGKFSIATRGSFDSEQARHANELLETQPMYQLYKGDIPGLGATPLFEIIYPENRIVLNYGDKDGLQFLGWVKLDTGEYMPSGTDNLFGDRITLYDLLQLPPRPNAEGWVVWTDPHTALKIKQDDYVALHKIVTNLNEKTVWQQIQNGPVEFRKFVADLPDELQPWADQVGFNLSIEFGKIMRQLDDEYISLSEYLYLTRDEIDEDEIQEDFLPQRKDFAIAVQNNLDIPAAHKPFMFAILDGRDYQGKVWKMLEPKGQSGRPRNISEEEA